MTKTELCKIVVGDSFTSGEIYKSSTVAVAAEYLGLLNKDEKEYTSNRGGIVFANFVNGKYRQISFREILSHFPD